MGGRWRSRKEENQTEGEDGAGKAVIFISSDDDEANEDLSLEIINKSRLRELKRKKAENKEKARGFFEDLSSSSAGETVSVPNGKATVASEVIEVEAEEEPKKKRKKRRKKKMRKVVDEETVAKKTDAPSLEVEPDAPAVELDATAVELDTPAVEFEAAETVDSGLEVVNEASNNLVLRKLLRGPRYFDLGPGSWESCYNCGKEGHVAANCEEVRRQKPCFVCGMFGHIAKNCMQGQDCFICKRKGHYAKDCPHKYENSSQDSLLCLRCGDLGHDMASCRNDYAPDDIKEIQCYVCKKYGHLCCVDYADNNPSQIFCYNCAEIGHSGQGCAKQRGENYASTPATICYRCGQEGHFARGCTNGPKSGKRYGNSSTPVGLPKDNKDSEFSKFLGRDGESTPISWSKGKKGKKDKNDKKDKKDKKGKKDYNGSKSLFKRYGESSNPVIRLKDKKLKKNMEDSKEPKSLPKNFGRRHGKGSPNLDRSIRPAKFKVKGGWNVDDTFNQPKRTHITNDWSSPITPPGWGNQNYYATSAGSSYSRMHAESSRTYNFHTSSGSHYSRPYTPHQRYNYNARTPNYRGFTGGYHHDHSATRFSNSYDYYG